MLLGASRTSHLDDTVLDTICSYVAVRLEQFAAGGRIGITPKSLPNNADNKLNDMFGVRLLSLEFSVVGTPQDFLYLETRTSDEPHDVRVLVESNGFE